VREGRWPGRRGAGPGKGEPRARPRRHGAPLSLPSTFWSLVLSPSHWQERRPPPTQHFVIATPILAHICTWYAAAHYTYNTRQSPSGRLQVVLPYYSSLPEAALVGLEKVTDFDCPKGETWDGAMRQGTLATSVYIAAIDGIPTLLVCPKNRSHSNLFVGDRIYGDSYNELEAYLYFSRCGPAACLENRKCLLLRLDLSGFLSVCWRTPAACAQLCPLRSRF
jgi:hypothetical protein